MTNAPDLTVTQEADFMREQGWSVAVHNDYRLNGEDHTFWLWTHPSGRFVKGEGRTDQEALKQCAEAILSRPEAHAGEVERPEGCVGEMPPERIIYFLERFKREEKWLGPHEQWAIDSAIARLAPRDGGEDEDTVNLVKRFRAIVSEHAQQALSTKCLFDLARAALATLDRGKAQVRDGALEEAVDELLTHRVGELPCEGWLRDNDASRAALAKVAAIRSRREGK